MYFTDDSLFPENMQPTIITAAPYGPEWLPGDVDDLPLTFDAAGAGGGRLLQRRRHDAALPRARPEDRPGLDATSTSTTSSSARVRQAVPKMIIQVGGSISFAPHTDDAKAKWLDYDTRHMLTELNPKPDFVTVTTGTTLWDITQAFIPGDADGHAPGRPEGRGRLERAWWWTRRRPSTSST